MALWDTAGLPRWELSLGDRRYPEQLARTPRPPRVLYVIGDPDVLTDAVAVVGARKATPYGVKASAWCSRTIARRGVTVVSGAAVGCDQSAHRAALAEGRPTVAVMGCGADVRYPSGSEELLARIAASGAVVSELGWGCPPARWAFRERNRIIAGLSAATVVVEAALPSGTFSTADFALEAGREVWAVPGSVFAPESAGSNRLISQGAVAIVDAESLDMALSLAVGSAATDAGGVGCAGTWRTAGPDGDPVFAAVRADAMRADDLARALGITALEATRRLSTLELDGFVVRRADGRYTST